jgi:germination protein M
MEALLAGPAPAERAAGYDTAIPEGTRLLDLDVAGGIATVDLSGEFASGGGSLSMLARVAQVVHTLTGFPTVDAVRFRLDGEDVAAIGGEGVSVDPPLARADVEDQAPAILVERPTPGEAVRSPLRLRGTANVFEAAFVVRLLDGAGRVLAERPAMATSGTGTRGAFAVSVPFEVAAAGPGTLVAFEESARDGRPINRVEVPLRLRP